MGRPCLNQSKVIFCVGANHKSADIGLRESLFLNDEAIVRVLPGILTPAKCEEALVLSTCNRLELVGVVPEGGDRSLIYELFWDLYHRGHGPRQEVTLERIMQSSYCLIQEDAVEHVFSVASGMDSLVVGETQITGQFKDALAMGQKLGTVGPVLGRLCQEALNTTGKIRTQTGISRKSVSISSAAVDLAQRVCGDLTQQVVLIIGAGEMSSLAAKYVAQRQPKRLLVANRSVGKAAALVAEIGTGDAFSLDELDVALQLSDVVISSTSKETEILSAAHVAALQKKRRYRPWFLIDIALPRDFPSASADSDNVFLFEIDDLKQIVAENMAERRQAAEEALGLISQSTHSYFKWFRHMGLKPALRGFRQYVDQLLAQELAKTLGRGAAEALTPDQIACIERMLASVAAKMSADAGSRVLSPPAGFEKDELAAALATLFPVDSSERKKSPK